MAGSGQGANGSAFYELSKYETHLQRASTKVSGVRRSGGKMKTTGSTKAAKVLRRQPGFELLGYPLLDVASQLLTF